MIRPLTMKKSLNNILSFCLTSSMLMAMCLLTGCSDFLKSEDKDMVIPRTVSQYQAMLHQHGFINVTWFYKSDFMTDDIAENPTTTTDAKNAYKSLYTWAKDIEIDGSGEMVSTNKMWEDLYNDVLVANYVLERAEEAEGTESERSQILAEARFLRARSYLELVNIYAPVYNSATANDTPGVPLRDGTGVSNTYSRNTVAEVYSQIISDLQESLRLFKLSHEETSLWHPNYKTALLLLSRTYLYMERWQDVVNTTTELISLCPSGLYNLNQQPNAVVVSAANPEVLHSYGSRATMVVTDESGVQSNSIPTIYLANGSTSVATYGISDDLLNAFHEGDSRLHSLSSDGKGIQVPAKWHSGYSALGAYTYRLSEAYLSRAEAYTYLGENAKALADVRLLLQYRVNNINNVYIPGATDAVTLRKFVLDERRLEFCFENHRWFDLRRINKWYPHTITHKFSLSSNSGSSVTGTVTGIQLFTLDPQSPNYTLEIPRSEQTINPTLMYNKREETVQR